MTNLARSGDVTSHLLQTRDGHQSQISQIPTDTDVVMFTIGGNDVNFAETLSECFAPGLRDPETCQEKVDAARTELDTVRLDAMTNAFDDHEPAPPSRTGTQTGGPTSSRRLRATTALTEKSPQSGPLTGTSGTTRTRWATRRLPP